MEVEREIALVFLEEARRHLQVLRDTSAPMSTRIESAQGLQGAAALVGAAEIKEIACIAEGHLREGNEQFIGPLALQLGARLEKVSAEAAAFAGADLASGFDAAEMALVRSVFAEEAHEHLEGITSALLAFERDRSINVASELLRKTHALKGSAATVGLHVVARAAHDMEEVFAHLRSGKLKARDVHVESLLDAVDTLRKLIDLPVHHEAHHRHVFEQISLQLAGARHPREGREENTAPAWHLSSLTEPTSPGLSSSPGAGESDPVLDERRFMPDRRRDDLHLLRVSARRIDALMDGVGELVFDRTRIERRVQELRAVVRDLSRNRVGLRGAIPGLREAVAKWPELASVVERLVEIEGDMASDVAALLRGGASLIEATDALKRTTVTLQEGLTQMRMLPLRQLFQRLSRPVRDMARRAGKRVELVTTGEDTELDKAVVELVTDPLVQLLRNAVAHGIESAHVRVARGKPPMGRITLGARHQGDSVYLEVEDDGAGIDIDKLRKHLISSGQVGAADAATWEPDRVIAMIFQPGVSSRDAADELAGRGVGLDVVRGSVARLGGSISVSSVPGQGTKFTVRLPLTTTVAQALLFKVAGQVYALPHVHVMATTYLETSVPSLPPALTIEGEAVPLITIHNIVGAEVPTDARKLPVVVLEFAGRKLAAACDKVVGPREIVIKTLGPLLAPLGLFAGATISGSGKVQLILDPAALARMAHPQEAAAQEGNTSQPPVHPSANLSPPGSTPRILVADDSRTVRESMSRMLSPCGYIVDVAEDGEEAWQMLQHMRYDLLVTDLEMPGLDGHELIERVRQQVGVGLPILVISSKTAAANRERVVQAGASAFLPKPVSRRVITERVEALLRRG
ncbi:MAG: response regulator [Deltaproteobacteria bacterium]|nr:response regulator [Deltaproteobacteria bacterium]